MSTPRNNAGATATTAQPRGEAMRRSARRRSWGSGTPSLEVIVAKALDIIDAQGVAALTTRQLATHLGMFQSNIYRRIRDRDHLLDLVVEAIMDEVGAPDTDPERDWRGWLTDCGVRIWSTWLRHPRAAVLLHHGGAYPATLRVIDGTLGVFFDGAFDINDAAAALQAYLGYVFGTTLLDALGSTRHADPAPAVLTGEQTVGYPHIAALAQLHVDFGSAGAADAGEAAFRAGLNLVLDAIAAKRVRNATNAG